MKVLNRNFLPFLFLFLFVYPQVEIAIHALEHADDFHCSTVNQKHFHEDEHSCSLCDYSFTSVDLPTYFTSIVNENSFLELVVFLKKTFVLKSNSLHFLLRAPPAHLV